MSGPFYVGGLRSRLIRDSLYSMLYYNLSLLGWFNSGRAHQPIIFLDYPPDRTVEIKFNTLSLADGIQRDKEWELGSLLVERRNYFYIDIFGESQPFSKHIIEDVADILGGRFNHIGRNFPELLVYDTATAATPLVAICQLEDIEVDRVETWAGTKPWEMNWYSCKVTTHDYYANEVQQGA